MSRSISIVKQDAAALLVPRARTLLSAQSYTEAAQMMLMHAVERCGGVERVGMPEDVQAYLVHLLTAHMYRDATDSLPFECVRVAPLYASVRTARSFDERARILRLLGDTGLAIAGLLPGCVERRTVRADYYAKMASGAYASLAEYRSLRWVRAIPYRFLSEHVGFVVTLLGLMHDTWSFVCHGVASGHWYPSISYAPHRHT